MYGLESFVLDDDLAALNKQPKVGSRQVYSL